MHGRFGMPNRCGGQEGQITIGLMVRIVVCRMNKWSTRSSRVLMFAYCNCHRREEMVKVNNYHSIVGRGTEDALSVAKPQHFDGERDGTEAELKTVRKKPALNATRNSLCSFFLCVCVCWCVCLSDSDYFGYVTMSLSMYVCVCVCGTLYG